ncbi:MAG: hypothetical protein Q8Q28_03685 [Pseudomonadota bacterium]|nr:hypothetical protein [Pseudomonadota bacterium]
MKSLRPHTRVLLALDGRTLERELLATLLRHCAHICPRLDILLLNPPREPTTMLALLLLRLEHSGIDYHVSSAHGDMGEEILRHLSRFRGINALALADPAQLSEEAKSLVELKGHQIVYLSTPERAD